jgi:suppressor of fused protein SUFU
VVSMTGDRLRLVAGFEAAVERHVRAFFEDHACTARVWTLGPMPELLPEFRVLEVAPGPKSAHWTYVSAGGAVLSRPDAEPLEFVLVAPEASARHVEIVTMVAHYNHGIALGEAHTMPIGDAWLPGSRCDHMLLLRPEGFGEAFERTVAPDGSARILQLVPITAAERELKMTAGVRALNARLDAARAETWRPDRPSVA